nr:non-ribosomal peptide synthetase [Pseudomonas sp. S09G 359]
MPERKALAVLLKQKGINLYGIAPVFRRAEDEPRLLSYAQQRQWFLWKMDPHSCAYTIPLAIRLRGALDVEALQCSFDALIARHESLRTVFVEAADGQVEPVIQPPASLELTVQVLAGDDPEVLAHAVEEQLAQPFDLATGPLVRARLLQLAVGDCVLVVTQHHIVSDAWSMGVMVDEVLAAYTALSRGLPLPSSELPIQYSDYAAWQRHWMDNGERDRQLAYWLGHLGDTPQPLRLPGQRVALGPRSHEGGQARIALAPALSEQLKALAAREGVTLFVLLLASFQALLHRLSGLADVRIGVPVANRTRAETAGLIGFFVNTQVLKADVRGEDTFSQLLAQMRDTALKAQTFQDLPFEQLVDALQPERSLSHSPLFQVMFNHQHDAPSQARALGGGLTVENLATQVHSAKFDLTLNTFEHAAGIDANFIYSRELFDAALIEALAGQWQRLLAAVVENPRQRIEALPVIDAKDQHQVRQWGVGEPVAFVEQDVLALFARQVAENPEALAVVDEGAALTYRQLEAAAEQLSRRLHLVGVRPHARVGVVLERSVGMVVAMLGVFKAGATYLPLAADTAPQRLNDVLRDSGAQVVVASGTLGSLDAAFTVIDIDQQPQQEMPSVPCTVTLPEQIAYVIYTSGSTGAAKGVMVSHGALANYVQALLQRLPPDSGSRMAMISTVAADLGHTVLFGALCSGRTLHLIGAQLAMDANAMAAYMATHRVDVMKIVPSHLTALLSADNPAAVLPAKVLILGGEACSPGLRDRLRQLAPDCQLMNHYGPTETTVGVLAAAVPEQGDTVPLGVPLANTSVQVLDASLQGVGNGGSGQLYIGGAGLAQGYLGQPALTAERFVPDPSSRSGARLYRSGDQVRVQDGVFDYQGRIDDQVKIRGYRVEPGEVTASLRSLPGVEDAAVVVGMADSGAQLWAYVVSAVPVANLLAQLRERLPAYMLPSHVQVLEQLPLTANGKLDRRALPAPASPDHAQQYQAPQGELAQRIAQVWQDVLKREHIGGQDNFFELGGDSIISIQVVSRARQAGIRFTPRDLFEHQTVQSLASVAQTGDGAMVIDQGPVSGALRLLPIQQMFFETPIPQRHHWNQSVLLEPQRPLQPALLEQVLQALVSHHDALRLSFHPGPHGWTAEHRVLQGREPLLWCETAETDAQCLEIYQRAQCSLDLSQGPLLRGVLLTLPQGGQRLLLAVHHLVVDGVSWRILFEDLQLAYEQLHNGQPLRLPAKASPFKAWSDRLHALAGQAELRQESDYWQARLSPVHSDLPGRRNVPVALMREAVTVTTRLDASVTRQLLQQAPAAYRTQINELLLAALSRVICRWTGRSSLGLMLEGHGREDLFDELDLTRTVGWFTNKYPVCLTPGVTVAQSIQSIKEELRAVPNKGLGFGALRYLGVDADQQRLRNQALPCVTFNYLGQFDASFDQDQGALFVPSSEAAGSERDSEAPLGNLLSLNGQVYGGVLNVGWTFSAAMFDSEVIQALADDYARELQALVEHCVAPDVVGLTPADFPLAGVTQAQLDALPLPARNVLDMYPLSPMQQGMLYHSLEAGEGDLYINQTCVPVQGLDVKRLAAAWDQVQQCHDILRTGFWTANELAQPLQIVSRQAPSAVHIVDWRQREVGPDDLAELISADCRQGFDMLQAPLMRVTLVWLDENRCHLIWTRHHILMDGWSSSRLLGEVFQAYNGQASNRQSRYQDYIAWLQRQGSTALEAFWREKLQGVTGPTELAGNVYPRPATQPGGHEAIYLNWDQARTLRLRERAQRWRVTPNTLIQAAWLLLLQRYTGQATVCFGATVAGRPASLPQADQILGLFINTLPIVQTPQPQQPLTEWLAQLQAFNLDARDYEHASLAEIQRWAGQSGRAMFDSIIVFENYPVDDRLQEMEQGTLQFGAATGRDVTNYAMDLAVNLTESLVIEFLYLRNRFSDESVQRIRGSFEALLLAMLDANDSTVGQLCMLTAPQREHLQRSNVLQAPQPTAASLLERIEAHVHRQPDAPAVICADRQLSYLALEQHANRMAHLLRERGVGPEVRVGVALNRSVEMIITLYAVHKAGGVYVPMDIDYPKERLQWIVEDSSMAVLVTREALLERLPVTAAVQVLDIDHLDLSGYAHTPLGLSIDPDHLAYLIYTSGSTGKPKGVAVARGPLNMHCQAIAQRYVMDTATRELLFMSFAFDGAQERWLTTLLAGGCLVLRDDNLWTAEETWQVLHEQSINIACFPPAYLKQLADYAQGQDTPPAVRVYCFGGDAVANETFELVKRTLRPTWITNGYGPTETVVTPLLWTADAEQACDAAYAPIGVQVGNRSLYVLDDQLNPLPDGVAGELYIGGEGLARGYHQRPGLTAERFVASPFEVGGRLYRSGDLVRRRADGVFDYLGRLDHQVKIRGFRIELGEIEARLRTLPEVRDAVVVARDSSAGKQLIGYVVAGPQPGLAEQLRQALHSQLPDYMVPAQLLVLPALPLNPSGKVDRQALPDPDFKGQQYVAPRNELERRLAAIWQEVLELEAVGVTDNFFEMGGDSLRTLKVLSKVRSLAIQGFELKLRDMLAKPTIAQLSGFDALQEADLDPLLLLNGHVSGAAPLFCLHAGFGTVFDYEPLARQLEGQCSVYGLQCRMLLDRNWEDDSLASMAIDYAQYIRQKQAQGPYRLLGWSLGGTLAVLVANELEKQGQRVAFLGLVDSFIPAPMPLLEDADWREGMPAFLRQTLGVHTDAAFLERLLPQAEPDLLTLTALFADLAKGAQGTATFGSEESARAFQVGLRLKALSRRQPALPATASQAQCWWRADLPASSVRAFEAGLNVALSERLAADHYTIVKHSELLQQVQQHLPSLSPVAG